MQAYTGARIFDGTRLHDGLALCVEQGRIAALVPEAALPAGAARAALPGGILAPGLVDLQVNGGGGVMLNDAPDVAGLRRIAAAHAALGATTILPTLISTDRATTRAAIDAVRAAVAADVPGIAGLHLEGPHLAPEKHGAHDPSALRPMDDDDLAAYCDAACALPALMITLAPEAATPAQVAALVAAGAVVSLGHSAAGFDACQALARQGASCVTHLFNAMSQMSAREPGLVGAALDLGGLSAGLIADGIHVHPAAMAAALRAKAGPGRLFLVSDAMAVAGTAAGGFSLGGREIRRAGGRLTLPDGTLAGADLDLPRAMRMLRDRLGLPVEEVLGMATHVPAQVAGLGAGRIAAGLPADMVHLDEALTLRRVWQRAREISLLSLHEYLNPNI